jgi:hypothetical protein
MRLNRGFWNWCRSGSADWQVTWRKPQVNGAPMPIDARLPAHCTPRQGGAPRFDGYGFVAAWTATCPGGIAGGTIAIEGVGGDPDRCAGPLCPGTPTARPRSPG